MKKASQKHRVIAAMMSAVMVFTGLSGLTAMADARVGTHKVLTIGADLTEEEKQTILRFFDVDESEVEVMTITNQDERDYLLGLVPEDQIGTHTYSCALVCPTDDNGIQVTTANMSYVTSDMIAATLSTSGVVNCDVLTAAPFRVSGTGALTGVMMSYEQASGESLDEAKKELANEELVVTNEVGEDVGQNEAILIVNGIKIRVVKDQVKGEEQVKTVVEEVVNNVETQINEKAVETGKTTVHVSEENKEKLVDYGTKYAEEDYQYDDVKDTLERVTKNTVEITGITDPITDSFDNTADDTVSDDSILNDVNDDALDDDAGVNSTASNIEDADQVMVDVEQQETLPMAEAETTQLAFPVREVSLSKIAEYSDYKYSPISGTNRMKVMEDGLNAVMDYEGNLLTDYAFDQITGQSGVLCAENSEGKEGVLDLDGNVIIPCKYDDISIENSYWALGINLERTDDSTDYDYYKGIGGETRYYVIASADLYNLKKPENGPMKTLTREETKTVTCYANTGSYIEIGDVFYDSNLSQMPDGTEVTYLDRDGKLLTPVEQQDENYKTWRGLSDAQGNPVLSPVYDLIGNGYWGIFSADQNNKSGLVAAGDNVAVPFEYGYFDVEMVAAQTEDGIVDSNSYCPGGYFTAVNEDKVLYTVWGGEVTGAVPVAQDSIEMRCAVSCRYVDENGLIHIYSADNVDSVYPESITGMSIADRYIGFFWKGSTDNGDSYLFDWHGNQLLDTPNASYYISDDGRYLAVSNGKDTTIYEVTYKTDQGDLHVLQSGRGTEFAVGASAGTNLPEETKETQPEPETVVKEETEQAQQEPETAAKENDETEQTASGAGAYLSSAIILLQSGSQNIESVKDLVNQAISALPDGSEAAGILASTITLMEGGSTDTGSMITLLETAKGML